MTDEVKNSKKAAGCGGAAFIWAKNFYLWKVTAYQLWERYWADVGSSSCGSWAGYLLPLQPYGLSLNLHSAGRSQCQNSQGGTQGVGDVESSYDGGMIWGQDEDSYAINSWPICFSDLWGSREDIEETWLPNSGLKDETRIHCDELGCSPDQLELQLLPCKVIRFYKIIVPVEVKQYHWSRDPLYLAPPTASWLGYLILRSDFCLWCRSWAAQLWLCFWERQAPSTSTLLMLVPKRKWCLEDNPFLLGIEFLRKAMTMYLPSYSFPTMALSPLGTPKEAEGRACSIGWQSWSCFERVQQIATRLNKVRNKIPITWMTRWVDEYSLFYRMNGLI